MNPLGSVYLFGTILLAPSLSAAAVNPAVITSVTSGGVGYVTHSQSANGVSASVGRWDTPYPNPETGEREEGLEPDGTSDLFIDIDVNDGGLISFSYRIKTYDAGIYDWLDVKLETPDGTITLASKVGKPGTDYGSFWQSAQISLSQSLDKWRDQSVRFVFSTVQDGWGDQSLSELINFDVRTCAVPPLTEITDSDAQAFEDGQTVNTEPLAPALSQGLACLETAVLAAGGTFEVTSAFRPPAYQEHLREVWDKWQLLRNRREPECAELREAVRQEFVNHELLLSQRPAAGNGAHTQGNAFDAAFTLPAGRSIDTLATGCNLRRPWPQRDRVHFQVR